MAKIKDVFTKEEKKIHELEGELFFYKKKYNQTLHLETSMDKIVNTIKDIIIPFPVPKAPKKIKPLETTTSEHAVLNFSDMHIGEIVKKEETKYNDYNFRIFCQRWSFLVDTIIDLLVNKLKGYHFEKLWINILGDCVCGIIHDELTTHSDLNILQQAMWAPYVVAQGIADLRKNLPVETINITGVIGNHGRTEQKKYFKESWVSWDYVFYQTLGTLLSNDKTIICNFPKSFFELVNINNQNCLLLHGSDIRSWLGIPFYGIQRTAAEFSEMLASENLFFEYLILAHFHNAAWLQKIKGSTMINGSFIGPTEYSIGKLRKATPPSQLLFGMHSKKRKTWEYNIDLSFMQRDYPVKYTVNLDKDIFRQ